MFSLTNMLKIMLACNQ